ncbi:hypothetical protein N9X68_01965, partial [Schleiferiaceae bacterium]|nr:hypothetical protein [Schleiferiaceae bacterium]
HRQVTFRIRSILIIVTHKTSATEGDVNVVKFDQIPIYLINGISIDNGAIKIFIGTDVDISIVQRRWVYNRNGRVDVLTSKLV